MTERNSFSTTNSTIMYNKSLCNTINSLTDENEEKDDGIFKNFDLELQSYPKRNRAYKEKFLLKTRRNILSNTLEKCFAKLYASKNCKILDMSKVPIAKSGQIRYTFTKKFSDMVIKGVEVNCRMITTVMNSANYSFNLSRIGNITFKGKFKKIFDELMINCKNEIEKFDDQAYTIRSAAMYIRPHNENLCKWPCDEIEKFMKNECNFLNSDNSNENNDNQFFDNKTCICFSSRQLIGQEIIPFIYDDDDNNEEEDNNECNDEDDLLPTKHNFLLDNLFFDSNDGELCGIKREHVKYKPNFLNTVDSDDCTALISFTLQSVGKNAGGLNLYLKPVKNFPIYCTNIDSVNKLPNAKQYLEEIMYNDNNSILQNLREDIKKRMSKHIFNKDEPIAKKIKKEEEEEEEEEKENNDEDDKCINDYRQEIDNLLKM